MADSSWLIADSCRLIHPPRLRSSVRFLRIVGRDVVSVLVKLHGTVMVAHVDFKLSRGAAPFPAIVRVSNAVVLLRNAERSLASEEQCMPDVSRTQAEQQNEVEKIE